MNELDTHDSNGKTIPPSDPAVIAGQANAALAASKISAAEISDTETPTLDKLHQRLQTCEALLAHLFQTQFRGQSVDAIVKQWLENQAGSEVINPHVKGPDGPLKPAS